MLETSGNIWDLALRADAICIPTNGIVNSKGAAVMGAGLALQASERLGPCAAKILGNHLKTKANTPVSLGFIRPDGSSMCWRYEAPTLKIEKICEVWTIPTKNDWKDKSDIQLIVKSCEIVAAMATAMLYKNIVLPKIGCGLGGLEWEEVKNAIAPILDDRFTVCG